MQIKIMLRFHLTPGRMATIKNTNSVGKGVRKKKSSYTVCGNVN
jgi:hypothetical protein